MIFRDFKFSFFPSRLVFDGPGASPPEGGQASSTPPEEGQWVVGPDGRRMLKKNPPEEPKTAQQLEEERAHAKEGVVAGTQEQVAQVRAVITEGPADKYLETFQKSMQFDVLTTALEEGMKMGGPSMDANFENWALWTDTNPELVVNLLKEQAFFPLGPGHDEMLKGFMDGRAADGDTSPDAVAQNERFEKAKTTFLNIIKALRDHFELKRRAKEDVQAQVEKPALGDAIGGKFKTLIKNFNRAPGMEKLMIGASVGIALILINKYKDSNILPFGNVKLSTAAMWVGALWGVNYLSGKASKDGKTLLQRLDATRTVDDLSDENILKGFAYKHEFASNEEKMRTLTGIVTKGTDIKDLFALYEEASMPGGSPGGSVKREIDPKKLGFFKGEVDGAHLYELVDILVKTTAVNERIRGVRETGNLDGLPENVIEARVAQIKKETLTPEQEKELFRDKYVAGELGQKEVNVMDVIFNEYRTANLQDVIYKQKGKEVWQQDVERGEGNRAHNKIKGQVVETYEKDVEPWVKEKYKWTVATGGTAWDSFDKRALTPFGNWIKARYNAYKPTVDKQIETQEGWYEKEFWLKKVLPPDLEYTITRPDSMIANEPEGEMTIMGYPGFKFRLTNEEDPRDNSTKEVVILDGIRFFTEDGVGGKNKTQTDAIKATIETKVKELVKAKEATATQLAGKSVEWDTVKKTWVVKKVTVTGTLAMGIPGGDIDLAIKVDADRATLHFFDAADTEITDFNKLAETHRDAEIRRVMQENLTLPIRGTATKYAYLEGLPINFTVTDNAAHIAFIKGDIAGLNFEAVPDVTPGPPKSLSGFKIYDPVSNAVGGPLFENLKVETGNGGIDFMKAYLGKLTHEPAFIGPFNVLKAQMSNTAWEGIGARWQELKKGQRLLGFIPANIEGALTGKIMQNQWNGTLDFKIVESMKEFQYAMLHKPLSELPNEYDKYIRSAAKKMTELSEYIKRLPNDEAIANDFEDLMRSKERNIGSVSIPAGIEYLNYPNDEYRELFKAFREAITLEKYNYAGIDKGDGSAQEIYISLLRVWSFHTREEREHSLSWPVPPVRPPSAAVQKDQDNIRLVTSQIQNKLDLALVKDKGVVSAVTGASIKKENLPAEGKIDTKPQLDEWMKP